jgi:hypothetical protein
MTDKLEKWAVENRNKETGWVVRVIECQSDWAAQLLSDNANKAFKEGGHPHESYVVKL